MKFLVAGLGNPGPEYANTRHNIGFAVLDAITSAQNTIWENGKHGWIAQVGIKGKKLHLLKPNTYMNLSGKAIAYWMQQEKIALQNVLIVTDDLALPLGKLRLKLKGNDGGHNGLKSISETLGTQEYARLRFGIGNDFPKGRQIDYVLGEWPEEDKEIVNRSLLHSIDAVYSFALEGPGKAMTKFNA